MSKVYIETERCKLEFNRMWDVLIEEGRGKAYKNSCVSGNPTLPIGTGRPQTFFTKISFFFFVGVFIVKVSIQLKKTTP